MRIKLAYIIICGFVFSCAPSKENELILQSIEIHESTIKLNNRVAGKILLMNSLLDSLREDKIYLKDSLAVLKQDYIDWESSIVDVPGHEVDHHDHPDPHGHDHDHDHAPPPDLTPEMVLEIQMDLNSQARQLDERAQTLMESMVKN